MKKSSILLIRRIRESGLPKHLKLLAMTMATYANANGSRIFPSVKTLAGDVDASERTVQTGISELLKLNVLLVVGDQRRRGGRGRTVEYRMHRAALPERVKPTAPFVAGKGEVSAEKGCNLRQERVKWAAPDLPVPTRDLPGLGFTEAPAVKPESGGKPIIRVSLSTTNATRARLRSRLADAAGAAARPKARGIA